MNPYHGQQQEYIKLDLCISKISGNKIIASRSDR